MLNHYLLNIALLIYCELLYKVKKRRFPIQSCSDLYIARLQCNYDLWRLCMTHNIEIHIHTNMLYCVPSFSYGNLNTQHITTTETAYSKQLLTCLYYLSYIMITNVLNRLGIWIQEYKKTFFASMLQHDQIWNNS